MELTKLKVSRIGIKCFFMMGFIINKFVQTIGENNV